VKRLIKFVLSILLVICGILIAAAVWVHFINLDPYRDQIANLATRSIGREVNINGHMDVNLFPHPQVVLNDITVANASWGSEPTMVSVGHIDAAVSFLSLFSDPIIVRGVSLNDVAVLLERNAQQKGNWVMGKADQSAKPKPAPTTRDGNEMVHLPVMVDEAKFSNVTLTLRAPEVADQIYHLASFSLQPDKSGNLILSSSGELRGNSMALNGKVTSKKSVSARKAVNADIQASLGDVDLTGQISTSRLATLADLKGTFKIAVKDIQKIFKMVELDAPLNGPLTADASASFDGSLYKATVEAKVEGMTVSMDGSYTDKRVEIRSALTPLRRAGELFGLEGLSAEPLTLTGKVARSDAENFNIEDFRAGVGQNRLAVQGRINTGGDAALSLTLSSPDLSTIIETLPNIDLKAKANADNSHEKIAISELAVTFDKSDLNGNIVVRKGDKQSIKVQLTSKLLDLRPFSKASKPDEEKKQATSAETIDKDSEKRDAKEKMYVFETTPIQLSSLQRVEADAKIGIDHFLLDLLELKKIKIDAAVHGGQVDAKFKCDSVNEGHAAGKIDLKTRKAQATIDTLVSVSDFRPKLLQAEGISQAEVPPITISLELQSAGASPRELASVANGRFLLTQGPGKIKNTALAAVSGDILSQLISSLNPFAKHEEFSNWECTVLKINLVDGLADIDAMLAQGEKLLIVGGGDIDLKTERLNLEFNTTPRKGIGISADMFVTPFVKVKGTLASPSVGLNKKGTLLTGGAAVATGGLSFLIKSAFDRATAEGDKCEKALEMAGQHTPYAF